MKHVNGLFIIVALFLSSITWADDEHACGPLTRENTGLQNFKFMKQEILDSQKMSANDAKKVSESLKGTINFFLSKGESEEFVRKWRWQICLADERYNELSSPSRGVGGAARALSSTPIASNSDREDTITFGDANYCVLPEDVTPGQTYLRNKCPYQIVAVIKRRDREGTYYVMGGWPQPEAWIESGSIAAKYDLTSCRYSGDKNSTCTYDTLMFAQACKLWPEAPDPNWSAIHTQLWLYPSQSCAKCNTPEGLKLELDYVNEENQARVDVFKDAFNMRSLDDEKIKKCVVIAYKEMKKRKLQIENKYPEWLTR